MGMVKLTSKNQNIVRSLSKVVWIVSRIIQPLMIIAAFFIVLGIVSIPMIFNQIKVEDDKITVANESFTYNYEGGVLELTHGESTQKIEVGKGIDLDKYIKNYSSSQYTTEAEILLVSALASVILLFLIFKKIGDIFRNIAKEDTPFTLENTICIKRLGIYYLIFALFPMLVSMIANIAVKNSVFLKLGVNFNLMGVIIAIMIFVIYYVFVYGYEMQIDSESKMYGNTDIEK